MKFKGQTKIEINGVEREFVWNMGALCELGDLTGLSITMLVGKMMDPSFSFVRDFMYVGAVQAVHKNKGRIDFSRNDVSVWVEDIGIEKCLRQLSEAIRSPEDQEEEKNQSAPETGLSGVLKSA